MEEQSSCTAAAERIPMATAVDQRRRGSPLAAMFLVLATCATLLAIPDWRLLQIHTANVYRDPDWAIQLVACSLPGGFVAILLAVYCTSSWRIIAASWLIGAAVAPVAAAAIQTAHGIGGALGGAALILAFAIVVRLAKRKPTDDPFESELPPSSI